ncbi:MAG: hypothetical protein QGH13_00405 [Candidatus Thalassarchaeaceae archaeon]|nr:hypothetical protein [Candidatus Thalassarchaeaceae archaeon]
MGRGRVRVILALLMVILLTSIQAESVVKSDQLVTLSEETIFLNALDSNEQESLTVGDEGVVYLIPNDNPEAAKRLDSITNQNLNALDFHPGGNAFIVGDLGRVLRYDYQDQRLSNVSGTSLVEISTLTSVSWNTNGAWAYIAADTGRIWRFRSLADGGEMHALENTRESPVTSIDCHPVVRLCVVSTESDGIGIIDTEHEITWIGGSAVLWNDLECATGNIAVCIAVGSNRNIGMIRLDDSTGGETTLDAEILSDLTSELTNICGHSEDRMMITTTPYGLIDYRPSSEDAFPWYDNADAVEEQLNATSSSVVCSWSTSEATGWILNSRGIAVSFVPIEIDDPLLTSLAGYALAVVVVISVPGIVLGLIFMNSPKMQATYSRWRRKRKGLEPSLKDKREQRRKRDRS